MRTQGYKIWLFNHSWGELPDPAAEGKTGQTDDWLPKMFGASVNTCRLCFVWLVGISHTAKMFPASVSVKYDKSSRRG